MLLQGEDGWEWIPLLEKLRGGMSGGSLWKIWFMSREDEFISLVSLSLSSSEVGEYFHYIG